MHTSLFGLVARFIRQKWRNYASSALMLAGVAALTVWIPRHVGAVVDALASHRLTHAALGIALAELVAAGFAIYFLRVGWRQRLYGAAYQLGMDLRTRLYLRLTLQGPTFYLGQSSGDLMALATNDIDAVEMAAGEAVLAGFDGILTLLMVLAMMTLGVDWRLTLCALLPFPLMALAFNRISRQVFRTSHRALNCFGALNAQVQESLTGIRTLRALGQCERAATTFAALAEDAADASFKAQRWEAAYEPVVGVALTSAAVLALGAGSWLVWHGYISIGQLTSFSMYLGQLIWPMFAAGWVLTLFERGRAAWSRLEPVLSAPDGVDDSGLETPLPLDGDIRVDGLGFRYPGAAQATLSEIGFTLAAGRTLGVVGATGSGKSTLLRLLLRHYHPDAGHACWGMHPIQAYPLSELRAAIAWVPQESFLFSASIAENIALARRGARRDEIEQAARLAAVHQDIERFPQGYATPVGERGVTLSGGQRQRIALARALLADSALLMLDDALSAVDTETEASILAHLREARRGRRAIIVSHRLSAVADADWILVLKDGRIAAQGSHDDLLLADGWYARQWRYQQLEASLDAN
ncbi:ABC transporter ATP-binding protein [Paludibacterium yongneupense]|uniref:ABC transporter ATP-binding protein n=1 Tax=Paludibacterium yongneupense TaxID=400061 RepID=UPI0003F9B345|nr:ABC transporter transmembrane domain-containing protein [Paludibacterium yongneupense]